MSLMKFFFSNAQVCELYTWRRVVSATHDSLEIEEQLEHFSMGVLTIWPDQFFKLFNRHDPFLAVIGFSFSF